MLNVAIIGLGIGEQHLIGFKESKEIGDIYVYDFNKTKLNEILNKYDGLIAGKSDDDLLTNPNIDIVSIASFDQYHCNQILKALDTGKHVFCEKPICQKSEEFDLIKNKLLSKPNLKMTTNTILRTSPRFLDLKKKIENNYFGEIFYLELDYNYGRLHKLTDGWRGKIKDFSVLFSGGIHMVDLLNWFLKSEIESISGFSNDFFTKKLKIKDNVVALIKLKSKTIVKLSCNFGCIYPHFHRVMVYGTNATYEQSYSSEFFLENRLNIKKKKTNTNYPGVKKSGLIKNFIESILYDKSLTISTHEMLKAMEICLRINQFIDR